MITVDVIPKDEEFIVENNDHIKGWRVHLNRADAEALRDSLIYKLGGVA